MTKSFFDIESNQFDTVNLLHKSFRVLPFSFKNLWAYLKIALPINRCKWIDSSADTNNPPDFYSDKYKLMCDFMRVDEYEQKKGVNPALAHEREVINDLPIEGDCTVFLVPDGTKLFGMQHDYEMYLKMIDRVLMQHNKRVRAYNNNHPGFKSIFVVFDESSLYVEAYRHYEREELAYGMPFKAKRMHKPYRDNNILNLISKLDCDYILWVNPFKRTNRSMSKSGRSFKIPSIALIEVKRVNKIKCISYNSSLLISTEDNAPKTL